MIPHAILIGNIISFVAAVLLALSCWTKNPKMVFIIQTVENLVLAASSIIFHSYSAACIMIISAVRSYVTAKERYNKPAMIGFTLTSLVLGLLTNTRGLIGILPVLGGLEFNYCTYRFKDIIGIKWTLIVNLLIWDVYAFIILDFSSGIAWLITIIITAISLKRVYAGKGEQPDVK